MRALVICTALVLAFCPVPGVAQSPETPAGPGPADLQALGFYIQQDDQASAAAELRRLRTEFPGWVPSDNADMTAAPTLPYPTEQVDTIYRQIAAGQLAEARATLDATKAGFAAWQPPEDMLGLLALAEGQVRLDAALAAADVTSALQIASATPDLLRCDRINNAWRIAQLQETGPDTQSATATYRAIIGACVVFDDIISTLEKSATAASDTDLVALFDTALSRFPANQATLASLQTRLMEGRGTVTVAVADATAPTPTPAKIRPRSRSSVVPVQRATPQPQPQPAPATGSSTQGCQAVMSGSVSAARLAERGWCAYNLERPMEAIAAFSSAEAKLSGTQRRDARFGLALSYLKLNMTEKAAGIAASTQLTPKQRVDTESIILDQRGVLAYQKKEYRKAIGYFNALEQISGRLRRDLALLRGYAYLNSGDRSTARELFLVMHNQLATDESRAAMRAAQ